MRKFIMIFALCGFSYLVPESEVIALINRERPDNKLAINWQVARLARYRAEEMQKLNFFGHNSPIYGLPDDMLLRFGIEFSKAGASIALGQETAQTVANAWLTDPKHRVKLLNPSFTHAGVGLSFCEKGLPHWTLLMISCTSNGTRGIEAPLLPVFNRWDSIEAKSSL